MPASRCQSANIVRSRTLFEDAKEKFWRAGSGEEVGGDHLARIY